MHRCGVEPGPPALDLAQAVDHAPHLTFAGLMGYEGHLVFVPGLEKRVQRVRNDLQALIDTVEFVKSNGLSVEIVSAGGTGTTMITSTLPRITEIQAGSYVFMDGRYQTIEGVEFACALSLLTTVVSRPIPDRIIIDTGVKTISREFGLPCFKNRDDLELLGLSEEHGTVRLADPSVQLQPGDTLELIPSHGDTTLNIHDAYYCLRNSRVEAIRPFAARGRSQ